jgi:hypothetical protein
MRHVWNKNAFWDVNNKKWRKWCNWFHCSYLITLMAYLCYERTPNAQFKYYMFDWLIYRPFTLNTGWKRDSLQIMLFVYVYSTWGMFEIRNAFWDVNNKKRSKWYKFVSPFLSNKTFGLIVLTKETKCKNQVFYV